jgi:hypothetical protein
LILRRGQRTAGSGERQSQQKGAELIHEKNLLWFGLESGRGGGGKPGKRVCSKCLSLERHGGRDVKRFFDLEGGGGFNPRITPKLLRAPARERGFQAHYHCLNGTALCQGTTLVVL